MSVVGLITEYNPFHNGHLYHIQEAKKISGANHVVVVMSGNFVQRGTVALIDKYTRTKMALAAGADLVIELPVCYATASAEYFALGAVSILDQLGFVDTLVFGSESGNITDLQTIASLYTNEPKEVTIMIKELLKTGHTYPSARALSYLDYIRKSDFGKAFFEKELEALLNSPNNILGIEYLKALQTLNSNIHPLTIKRIQSEFHSKNLDGEINSATAIRKALSDSSSDHPLKAIRQSVPDYVYDLLVEKYQRTFPLVPDDANVILQYKLLSETPTSLSRYLDVTPELANRILNLSRYDLCYDEMILGIKSRQYTQTRIQRAFAHILLDITKESLERFKKQGYTSYARVLGLRKSSSHLLRKSSENDAFQIISKLSQSALSEDANEMLMQDIKATNLYNLLIYNKFGTICKNEYTHGLVLI